MPRPAQHSLLILILLATALKKVRVSSRFLRLCTPDEIAERIAGKFKNVDDFVAAKASDFNKDQQSSMSGLQQVQYQSVKNLKFQQASIDPGIWFGIKGVGGSNLSPRPIKCGPIISRACKHTHPALLN
jgi:hypothetical protein